MLFLCVLDSDRLSVQDDKYRKPPSSHFATDLLVYSHKRAVVSDKVVGRSSHLCHDAPA